MEIQGTQVVQMTLKTLPFAKGTLVPFFLSLELFTPLGDF